MYLENRCTCKCNNGVGLMGKFFTVFDGLLLILSITMMFSFVVSIIVLNADEILPFKNLLLLVISSLYILYILILRLMQIYKTNGV